jgi:hypothetical protein
MSLVEVVEQTDCPFGCYVDQGRSPECGLHEAAYNVRAIVLGLQA